MENQTETTTQKPEVNPTASQKAAFDELVESGGKSVSKAMRNAKLKNGKNAYSPKTAKNPKKLTESRGWDILMETYLPEEDLAKAHKELLNAGFIERIGFEKDISDEDIMSVFEEAKGCKVLYIRKYENSDKTAYVQMVDNNARKNALEMAYKLKGIFAPVKTANLNLNIEISPEDQEKINKALDEVL